MKKAAVLLLALLLSFQLLGQLRSSIEIIGARGFGVTLNTAYKINLLKSGKIYVSPQLTLGHFLVWENQLVAGAGLLTGYQLTEKYALEINSSMDYLMDSPFYKNDIDTYRFNSDGTRRQEFLWINSVDLRFKPKKLTYIVGGGIYIPVERYSISGKIERLNFSDVTLKVGIGF